MRFYHFVIALTCLSMLCLPANGLRCLRCSSEISPFCRYGIAASDQCSEKSSVCVTYVGRISYLDSNVVIRDCAENDYGNFCQQFELESPGVAVAATQQQQTKHEICISTCRSSSCNKVPVVE